MRPIEPIFRGKTFDDFSIEPQEGILPSRKLAKLSMRLIKDITLHTPIAASNMDTVTGAEMAKAMALHGGLGFIHRNCTVADQVRMVEYVKRQYAYIIDYPLILPQNTPINVATNRMEKMGISCVLVCSDTSSKKLAGIFSHRDVPPENNEEPIGNFMTPLAKLICRAPGISLEEAEKVMFSERKEKLPLIDALGHIKGLITMRDLKQSKRNPHSSKDVRGRLLVGAAIGAAGDFIERARALIDAGVDCILIDIAHAHNSSVMKPAIEQFRKNWPEQPLICGNIGTRKGAKFLEELGVDAIKVGIGPGRGCRTRLETGFGVPQLQAIREAYCATEGKIPIIADGGIKNDKDIFMAIAAGASTVMLGSMLSGAKEAPGILIEDPATKQRWKLYRGMTSPEAVIDGSDDAEEALETPAEGQTVKVPYTGSVVGILNRIRGHLKSSVSYSGCRTMLEAHEKITYDPLNYFIELSVAAQKESYDR